MMPKVGVEPTPCFQERILNPPRLPFRHFGRGRLRSVAREDAGEKRAPPTATEGRVGRVVANCCGLRDLTGSFVGSGVRSLGLDWAEVRLCRVLRHAVTGERPQ